MRIFSATFAVAAVGLSLSGTAHAQDVRMPQGEYFTINGSGGDWFRAMPADPGSETSGSSTGMLNHQSGFNEYVGVWTIDHATGAMTISYFAGDKHCDAWPDYVVGEIIDMTVPSEKTCWIPGGTYGTEMTYVGLNPPEE
ncbi:MAG: hypothetical protein ACJAU5_001187 [Maricaulis maris]|jgi:hypothetical protein|uniref:hypothetical protein n=1 Tax=Maricaulis maris TaxID=74318 RepID=UPI0026F3764E|nr:hypothetical protein [Maricaulis maris]